MITRDYSDKDLRAVLGSSPPLEKMKMGHTPLPPQHSPLPWVDNGDGWIFDAKGECLGCLDNSPDTEIAVKAVNAYYSSQALLTQGAQVLDERLDKIKDQRALITELVGALGCFIEDPQFQVAVGGNPNVVDAMLANARAVLARAKASHGAGT